MISMSELISRTKQQMQAITGMSPETVSRLDATQDGWSVGIDMVEHQALPRTYDLLASFDVSLNATGEIRAWHRTARFVRNQQSTETDLGSRLTHQ
jgi:hypothetical protein